MPLLPAKLVTEVPPGSIAEFENKSDSFAICNVAGEIHCVDGICPHAEGPLAQGALHGHTLVCPWHGWEFDVRTGDSEVGDCKVKTYPTVVQDGRIFIQIP
jgi:nitrite reductase/ring-hydroxylating ferredoxin subunit